MVCGVLLSGGMSRRFQAPGEPWVDKALHVISGAPMIQVVYGKLSKVSSRVVVALGFHERVELYERVLGDFIPVVDDSSFRGPVAGIYAALKECGDDIVLVAPVDMPYVSEDLLGDLLDAMSECDMVSPILPNGLVETTLIALRGDVGLWVLDLLKPYNRSRIADIHRGAPRLCLINARKRGFKPVEFVNVNRREDISLTDIPYPEGPLDDDVILARSFTREDVERRDPRVIGSLWGVLYYNSYMEEFKLYAEKGVYMLAAYALLDSPNTFERSLGDMIVEALKKNRVSL